MQKGDPASLQKVNLYLHRDLIKKDMTQSVNSVDLIVWNRVKKLQWSTRFCSLQFYNKNLL